MKYTLLLLVVSCCFQFVATAQLSNDLISETQKKSAAKENQDSNKLYFLVTESFPLEKKGKIYLNNQFVEGTIIDFEGDTFRVPLRYRFADDQMQITHLGKTKALYPQKINKVVFENGSQTQTFAPLEYAEEDVKVFGYFEVLSSGKVMLLKAYRKKGKDGIKTILYTKKEGELAEEFKAKKSCVLKTLKSNKSEVSKYISKEKLNVKHEQELIKVFDFYNSGL